MRSHTDSTTRQKTHLKIICGKSEFIEFKYFLQGRQYDAEGNLKDWWEEETKEKFLDKAECIIWQYGNYTARSVNLALSGINTQGENIADNGGIKEAYRAYG